MSKKWELRKVSTLERISEKVKTEMAQPVGIVLFGANGKFNNEIADEIMAELHGFARRRNDILSFGHHDNLKQIWVGDFERYHAVFMVMDQNDACKRTFRKSIINSMREAGAASVVEVYVKASKFSPKAQVRIPHASATNQLIDETERSQPTSDNVDYLIVVE